MDKAGIICSALWMLYVKFCKRSKKTDKDWDTFMAQCQEIVNQHEYKSPEFEFAEQIALAFINYAEAKEKERKEYNTHG